MTLVLAPDAKLDLMATHMKAAAEERGIPTAVKEALDSPLGKIWLSFIVGGQEFLTARGAVFEYGRDPWGRLGRNVNHEASLLIADKYKTKKFLEDNGFSVPKGQFFRRRKIEEAYQAFDTFSGPICVKPNHGSEGHCVFPGIRDRVWYKKAIDAVAEHYPTIVIEESIEGEHFRFFYVQPDVVGIRYGLPANVIGDGVSTIAELAEAKNAERVRRALPTHPVFPIDEKVREYLERHGRSLEDVPEASERVFIQGVSNATAGADSFLLWDEVHPSYREVVEQACAAIPGLLFSGVDIIIKDIAQPAAPGNHWFLEINSNPAISSFYYPWEGEVVDVAGKILDMLIDRYGAQAPD